MKSFDLTSCRSLAEFYSEAKRRSEEAHGDGYTLYLDKLHELAPLCRTYKELGVNQGISAAAVGTGNPEIRMTLVDRNLTPFRIYERLFPHEITLWETLSVKAPPTPCDLLFVDSAHNAPVLQAELLRHGKHVRKFIVAHDTSSRPELRPVLEKFADRRKIMHDDRSCGFTVIWM